MGKGRRPVPTSIKVFKGNPGKRKLNEKEPKPTVGFPPMPKTLSRYAKQMWQHLDEEVSRLGVVTLADAKALEALCECYAEWRTANEAVKKLGLTCVSETKYGQVIKARPEVQIAHNAMRRMKEMLCEFGLTPSSRSKVKALPTTEKDEFEELVG